MKGESSESDRAQVAGPPGGYEEARVYNKAVGIGYMQTLP